MASTRDHSSRDRLSTVRVLIIGGGAAGSSAAYALARHNENETHSHTQRFVVSLWEKSDVMGGVATTESLSLPDGTTVLINDGVQGGALSYRNTLQLHESLGFSPSDVCMKVSFGKDKYTWSNIGAPSELIQKLQPEIERFGVLLRWIDFFQIVFVFVSIQNVLWLFQFSKEFGDRMIYPLVALFFGTGNQTPHVSALIISKVFLDPKLRLFDYCPKRLLSTTPQMFSFSLLGDIYKKLHQKLVDDLQVDVCLNRAVSSVQRSTHSSSSSSSSASSLIIVTDQHGVVEVFDKIIFACDAETVLKILVKPTFLERWILGSVRYYDDVTVTHCDEAYMRRHYEYSGGTAEEADRTDYFIYTNPEDPSQLEMSFDLGHYQPSLRPRYLTPAGTNVSSSSSSSSAIPSPSPSPIYQSIFLDKGSCESSWTWKRIDPAKVLLVKWWRQFSHEVSHFFRVVPFVRWIQGSFQCSTFYCGSWTLVNTHEIAVISGLAAAHQLGAAYPFVKDDELATLQFDSYLSLAHGASRRTAEHHH